MILATGHYSIVAMTFEVSNSIDQPLLPRLEQAFPVRVSGAVTAMLEPPAWTGLPRPDLIRLAWLLRAVRQNPSCFDRRRREFVEGVVGGRRWCPTTRRSLRRAYRAHFPGERPTRFPSDSSLPHIAEAWGARVLRLEDFDGPSVTLTPPPTLHRPGSVGVPPSPAAGDDRAVRGRDHAGGRLAGAWDAGRGQPQRGDGGVRRLRRGADHDDGGAVP